MNYPLTLEQYIAQMPMKEYDLVNMGAQIAEALAAIHQQGHVHGDVKPGNVLLVAPGSYQLIGMESVRQYPVGTIPAFVAPELMQGGAYYPGTDVYSLGMMMKSLIPKQGVSGVLDEILRKACEPEPARRYGTALAFAEDLQTLQAALGEPVDGFSQQSYVQSAYGATIPEQSVPMPQPYMQAAPEQRAPMQEAYAQAPKHPVNQRQQPVREEHEYAVKQQTQSPKKKDTKETQKASLALRFLLPILLVLIIGAAVAVYVILIHPTNKEEETTTTAPTTEATTEATESTTAAATTEETTEATTEEAECPYEYSQKITVTAHAGSTSGMLTVYNWENGGWVKKFAVACVLGKNGIGSDYGEGKGVTPMGTFKLGFLMANVNPKNYMNFKMASSELAIVDDVDSERYNTLVDTNEVGDVSVDHIGANIVNGKLNAIIYIEHNGDGLTSDGVIPGKGSVITICGNYDDVSETAGCIDISAENMTDLLTVLDGRLNPYIEITLD